MRETSLKSAEFEDYFSVIIKPTNHEKTPRTPAPLACYQ